ncbi:hypothetical protein BD311DRAFT_351384 [Dichomitus squalens]|uniref:Uncharacterized protein n=1 Tax=Dichomitus squalens TaxID=114155 RepID=A0A4V2K1W3_9APHY|nr:hypothetical protein BD311DRAFT_351384 [Dichomitus squalens]
MSSPPSLPSAQTAAAQGMSVVQRAYQKFLNSLDDKAKMGNFFVQYCVQTNIKPLELTQINNKLQKDFGERRLKTSTPKRVLQALVAIQKRYASAVTDITSFDPTSISGVVWTCVGALADFADRYSKLSETMDNALTDLAHDLNRLSAYERLFNDSPALDDILCQSYVDIFHFWSRVYRELHRTRAHRLASAFVSLSSDKLDKIVQKMRSNTMRLKEQAELVSQELAQTDKLVQCVRDFLGSPFATGFTSAANGRLPGSQHAKIEALCCEWITGHSKYQDWRKGNTPSPALWVYGPPGSGKSTLCRQVVCAIKKESSVFIASHYFRFDQNHTALEVLKSLAAQLWEAYSKLSGQSFHDLVQVLARLANDRITDPISRVQSILHELTTHLPATIFFLDGVDEEFRKLTDCGTGVDSQSTTQNAHVVLGVLDDFVAPRKGRGNVRLWISSQDVSDTRQNFGKYTPFDIKDSVKSAIRCYLTKSVEALTVIPLERRESILTQLGERVKSNFLWAHLIVVELGKATTLAAMDEILDRGRAEDLDAYYCRFLDRLLHGGKASLARDVFSLVTFARRPLRIEEVREAVAMLHSSRGHLEDTQKPFAQALLELFPPLIEVQDDRTDSSDVRSDATATSTEAGPRTLAKTCRLFHSTLFDYLRRHADIFCEDEDDDEGERDKQRPSFRVCPLRIADACLRYLAQDRYSRLLWQHEGTWVDMDRQSVAEHTFLTYSAKNWDKHLDLVAPNGVDLPFSQSFKMATGALFRVASAFRTRVQAFLSSSNFQTCIQIQNLWIDGAFSPYAWRNSNDGRVWVRRNLPRWTVEDKYCRDYHRFWWDWHLFLSCSGCDDPSCAFRLCIGEVDRCWWGALGPDNFLSKMKSRYQSFRFQAQDCGEARKSGQCFFQTALATHDAVKVLRLASVSDSRLHFVVETWSYDAKLLPTLQRSQTLNIPLDTCKASFYAAGDINNAEAFSVCSGGAGVQIASFSADGRCLRIGSRVYAAGDNGEYFKFNGIDAEDLGYIEEIAGCEDVIAVARRQSPPVAFDKGPPPAREADSCQDGDSDSEWADSDDESVVSDSSADSVDQGYETSSSCSSAADVQDSDAESNSGYTSSSSEQGEVGEYSDSTSEDDDNEEDDDVLEEEEEDTYAHSDSDDGIDPSAFAFGQLPAYGDRGEHRRPQRDSRGTKRSVSPHVGRAVIQVYVSEERRFRFRRKSANLLSDSPPVIHPSEPLLVWPLGGRDVLFADYEDSTYFIREVGEESGSATTLTVKCHFAKSERHLHIAVFEGRATEAQKQDGSAQVTLLVHTYRLCSKKPTRSPPNHIHTSLVDLGTLDRSQLSQRLPCTLTWTDSRLYVSWSGLTLSVFQVNLFSPCDGKDLAMNAEVQCPREIILLPSSARYRDTFFFPARESGFAKVIIGGPIIVKERNTPPTLDFTTPVGCLLHPEDDLGGWVKAENAGGNWKQDSEAGRLNRPLEQFDPDVDCVLEPFLWQG